MRPMTDAEIRENFGTFQYISHPNGSITIHKSWVARNIIREDMAIVGVVACHRQIVLDLMRIFLHLEQTGLAEFINVNEFKRNIAGCWVPRHKTWNTKRGLSRHSWGVAIDTNVAKNGYGKPPTMHPGIVKAFEARGFYWGGRFSCPDGMHFEPSDQWRPLALTMPSRI